MAVEPLYNATLETLLKRTRIDTADDDQTNALVTQSVTEVRLGFYRSLGRDRAKAIAGYPLTDNPDTDEEILRARGAAVETLWLTWLLAQRLPFLFMDNRASTGDIFNDEPLTRDAAKLQDFLDALKEQIDEGLGELTEPEDTNAGAVKVTALNSGTVDLIYDRFLGLYPHGTNARVG